MEIVHEGKFERWSKNATVGATHLLLSILSIYLVWGWITIADIKAQCAQKGIDYEQAIEMMKDKGWHYSISPPPSTQPDAAAATRPETVDYRVEKSKTPFSRFRLPIESIHIISSERLNPAGKIETHNFDVIVFESALLDFFFMLSDNIINTLFSFGAGYLFGLTIVLLRYLKKKPLTRPQVMLRPISGGLVAAMLFLFVLAGGKLMWNQASSVNVMSVGVIAAIGGLFCEKFEDIMTTLLALKKPDTDDHKE